MRLHRSFTIALACAAALTAASAAASPVLEARAASRATSVRVLDCDPDRQEAVFRGAMKRVRGAERMMLRFALLQRRPGGRFEMVGARGLNRWKRSRAGVARFAHRQRVRNLRDGRDYRVRVDFRWLDGDGDVIRRGRRWSGICYLSEPLPDLQLAAVEVFPEGAGARYSVTVHNGGRDASPETSLHLRLDGALGPTGRVPALAPDESASVSLVGPRCLDRVRAVVDPVGLLAEADEHNNARAAGCP